MTAAKSCAATACCCGGSSRITLSNALRYTERGGVVVGCRRRGGELEIAVYDTGPGIAEHQRQRIVCRVQPARARLAVGREGFGARLVDLRSPRATDASSAVILPASRGAARMFGVRVPARRQARRAHAASRARNAGSGARRPARPAGAMRGQRQADSRWHGGAAGHSGAYMC